jgi:hypothetical protein
MPLVCEWCSASFQRPGTRGPKPRFCSVRCRGRWAYSQPHIKAYQQSYAKRPDRRAVRALANAKLYATDKYKEWARERWRRKNFVGVEISAPYTGHRWLDMARRAVKADLDSSAVWADDYHDEMGEAVLALLEGRDMEEAITAYRRKEYVPRRLTIHMGDWKDDDDERREGLMPASPSAEEEVMVGHAVKSRVNWSKNSRAGLKAGSRKGSRGPNRSHRKFRSNAYVG